MVPTQLTMKLSGKAAASLVRALKAGAVAGDDQFRVEFLQALDGVLDEVVAAGGEVEAADDQGDFIARP